MLGVSRQRVSQLCATPDFPVPQAELASGRVWLRDEVEKWIDARGRQREAPMMEKLKPPERQVLEAVAAGCSIPEVAEALAISERTARNHIRNVVAKLSVLAQEDDDDQ